MWTRADHHYGITLTAPSELGEHCKKAHCDGQGCAHEKCRCTPPEGIDLAVWNPTAAKRWNHFLLLIEQTYGVRPRYFRGVESQDGKRRQDNEGRGALHAHAILSIPRKMSTRTLRRLAIKAGFGHELVLDPLTPGSKSAAHYISKYVTKTCDVRDDVPWAVDHEDPLTGEVVKIDAPATFRTWSQSANWGTTMKAIRARAHHRWLMDQLCRDEDAALENLHAGLALATPAPAD